MLRVVPYALIYLFTRFLALFCVLLPSGVAHYVRVLELHLLYLVYSSGPGGFDDGVQILLMKNSESYAKPLVTLLRKSSPGSSSERIALSFIELVRGTSEVDLALAAFGERHPNPETKDLVLAILASKPPGQYAP
ncbi:MAG TPA: hypothetical protein VG962_10230 [Steroidobacteraceae bacterium]|nr:hypothetical protein [Steroidobacteraceae bacterium]